MALKGMQAANFNLALRMLGAGVGNRLDKRSANKKLMAAMQGLAGPEASYDAAPPIATRGQRDDLMDAMSGAVAQQFTPEQRTAAQGRAGQAAGAIRKNTRGVVDASNAQRQKLIETAMLPGDMGKIAQMALLKQSGVVQPAKLQGAQKYMNLGDKQVLNMADETLLDFSGDEPKELKTLSPGEVLVDSAGKKIYEVPKGDERKQWQTEVGAGNGMMTKAIIFSDGKTIPVGQPYSGTQKQEITTSSKPLAGDKTYARQMSTAIAADQDAIVRSKQLLGTFNPTYQTVWAKAAGKGLEWADKLGVLPDGAAKDLLKDLSVFQRKTNENMNLYIKMITGAQMSEAEAKRLSTAIANLGDSPAVFEQKLKDSITVLEVAQKKKQEELEYYSGIEGITYEKAEEYSQAAAAKAMRLGMTGIGVDWSEEASKPASKTGGLVKGEDGVWRMEE